MLFLLGEAGHDLKLQKQFLSTRYVLLLLLQLVQGTSQYQCFPQCFIMTFSYFPWLNFPVQLNYFSACQALMELKSNTYHHQFFYMTTTL